MLVNPGQRVGLEAIFGRALCATHLPSAAHAAAAPSAARKTRENEKRRNDAMNSGGQTKSLQRKQDKPPWRRARAAHTGSRREQQRGGRGSGREQQRGAGQPHARWQAGKCGRVRPLHHLCLDLRQLGRKMYDQWRMCCHLAYSRAFYGPPGDPWQPMRPMDPPRCCRPVILVI